MKLFNYWFNSLLCSPKKSICATVALSVNSNSNLRVLRIFCTGQNGHHSARTNTQFYKKKLFYYVRPTLKYKDPYM